MSGIVSYGFYIPRFRILVEEIASQWGKEPDNIKKSLLISEKSVADSDEDSLTMAYESAFSALSIGKIKPNKLGAVYIGSESHPYAVNPTSTILAEMLGKREDYIAIDNEFACKAGSTALISILGLIDSGKIEYGLVVGSDNASAKPHDALEYTSASAASSFIIGKRNVAVEILDHTTYSTDTPDFWRRDGMRYPSHSGRFTGGPGYYHHVYNASKNLFKKTSLKPKDFACCIFHMPNGVFPRRVACMLGFNQMQLKPSLIVDRLGNSFTATVFLGICATLEHVKADDLIFVASYGSGAGSDAFVMRVTKQINKVRQKFWKSETNNKYISYSQYLKKTGHI